MNTLRALNGPRQKRSQELASMIQPSNFLRGGDTRIHDLGNWFNRMHYISIRSIVWITQEFGLIGRHIF